MPVSILIAETTSTQAERYRSFFMSRALAAHCVFTQPDIQSALNRDMPDALLVNETIAPASLTGLTEGVRATGYGGPIIVMTDSADLPPADAEGVFMARSGRGLDALYQTIMDALLQTSRRSMPEDLAGILQPAPLSAGSSPSLSDKPVFQGFIGTSPVMLGLYEQIQNASRSSATVFVTGESGTGKDVCAQAIHKYSTRRDHGFVPLNCAAIPRDLLESELFGHVRGAFTGAIADREGAASQAHNGTLFLDEIGEMDLHMQTKLLRFLQDGTFQRVGASRPERANCRIICATNRDPLQDIHAGRFREDLYYRLHVIPIVMPPLRQRGEDIIDIALTLLLRYGAEEGKRFRGFHPETESILRQHSWPGNIRQLQNIIRNIAVMHDNIVVTPDMLPYSFLPKSDDQPVSQPQPSLALGHIDGSHRDHFPDPVIQPLAVVERTAIENAIEACAGNIPRAAVLLGISPSTIYRKKAGWDEEGRL